jgi:hypothetical protein
VVANLEACQDLGHRYERAGQSDQAMRAFTSLVDRLPDDSESHRLLAEEFQGSDHWPEAIVQWQQVARIRALEPAGLLGLAAAQIHERQWDTATHTLRTLESRSWPQQSGDVAGQVRELRKEMAEASAQK